MKKTIFIASFFSFFTFHFSFSQSWLWGKMGIGDCWVTSIASDKNGYCYIVGLFPNDTIQLGSYSLKNPSTLNSNDDIFIIKIDQVGNIIWAKQTINLNSNIYAATSSPCAISLDGSGNIYINGNFPDTLLLGSFTLINNILSNRSSNTFIAKYNPNGNVIWAEDAKVFNDSSGIFGKGISSDTSGNSYVTGSFVDTIQFGTETIMTPSANLVYAFLVKYDSSGNVKWARQSTGNTLYGATSYCVASDPFENSIIGGGFEDSVTFGTYKLGSIPSETVGDVFITKYDSNGNVLWAKQAVIPSTYSGCKAWAITADKSGNIYVTGDFADTVTFGTHTIFGTSYYYNNFFVAKYAPNGNVVWVKSSKGLDNNDYGAQGISIDKYNHIYLSAVGGTTGTNCKVAFGGDTLSIDDTAAFDGVSLVFEIDSNGNVLCPFITVGGARLNCIASDTSGNYVYFGGTTATIMVFGNDTVNPFSVPVTNGLNFFPFVARWGGCDSNIITTVIPKNNIAGEVKVYPNPNNGIFTITLSHAELVSASQPTIKIYNILGEQVYNATLKQVQGDNLINLTGQPNGVYLYRVVSQDAGLIGEGKIIIDK